MAERLSILRVGTGGMGVGKAPDSDKVAFVPYTAPGDEVEVEIVAEKSRFRRGRLLKLLSPGPDRVEPLCPLHYTPGRDEPHCGGCDWQQLSVQAQERLKRDIVRDCLSRLAGIEVEVLPTLSSPEPWRYRNKVLIPFQPDGAGVRAGFFQPGTHRVVPFEDCRVQPELSVRLFRFVRGLAERRKWPAYDEHAHKGWLRHVFIRTSREGKAMLGFVTLRDEFREPEAVCAELREAFPELVGIQHNVQQKRTNAVFGPKWHRLWGKGRLREKVGRLTLAVSPPSFLQVNTPASERLYDAVREMLSEGGFRPPLLLDLYSGIGSLALYLSDLAEHVAGVEENRRAVDDANMNAELNGVTNARFLAGKAEFVLPRMEIQKGGPWAAVLDPPRQGCEPAVLDFLARKEFERVLYVSCDPASFARDAALLAGKGWKLDWVQPVDLFPQTSHVEIAGRFVRG